MTAAQHHAEAERLLDNDGGRLTGEVATQRALVHAVLALTAPRGIGALSTVPYDDSDPVAAVKLPGGSA